MEWTSWAGRKGPVELDALRVLVVVHRLGHEPRVRNSADSAESPAGPGDWRIVAELDDERRVQHLDHLLAHPATLAYLLMDAYLQNHGEPAEQRGALARRVRWLLANDRRRYDLSRREPARRARSRRRGQDPSARVDVERFHRFRPFVWRRWDDALALLQTRGLLRITADTRPKRASTLHFGLTERASSWLDSDVYPHHGDAGFQSQVCTVIADYLPNTQDIPTRLAEADERLAAFRRDESLGAADDAAAARFYSAFRERL